MNIHTLYRKVSDTMRQVGVLVKPDGTVLSHYVDSELFRNASKRHPEWLCGIYTSSIFQDDLQADIEYMGGKLE
jgi:hypothetical protein